ncbi:glycoside hydrolase family 2 TIM barrel-domain containing protein [Mucilaginibacter sp. PAMB04168]|uniref:glycoside hydrolase family 2 TIM barrel-domain containing protein n=1 Tax=Mucilaginibacter sp. PAMB04168 TaxID=3138567 RepID=UPI0031F69A3F
MSTLTKRLLILLLLFQVLTVHAQRIKASINTNWQFYKGDIEGFPANNTNVKWETISIPHSWNTADVTDDEKGYYRGTCWYTKRLSIPASWQDKYVSVYFEGASQVAEVYVNGKKAGAHIGGYSAFNIPVKQYLNFAPNSVNVIAVKLNNKHNDDIPPLSADFTFFGGIYRDVYLVATNPVHFDTDDNASAGIFVTTPNVSAVKADVNIAGAFVNQSTKTRSLRVITRITDNEGKVIAQKQTSAKAGAGQKVSFTQNIVNIMQPALWSPESPYLYKINSVLVDADTKTQLDEVNNPLGFRWYDFDAQKGFFLNGKHYKLMGASRHQDYKDQGNALPDAMHVRDVELLKNMGANYLRVAHYPQDPEVLQACDRLGVLASVEIPIVNQITESAAFAQNSKNMQVEMIRQNFNHPSLIIWAYMNEVLLRLPYANGSVERQTYLKNVAQLAQQLEDLTRKEDPYRYTMIPNHGSFELYNNAGLTKIPKIVGWNLYQGWYGGDLNGFAQYLDRHHKDLPDKPLIVTEYGADADPRVHSMQPVRFDKSNEYAVIYHKAYLKAMNERAFVAGGAIWNLADFNSEQRAESMPHINNKGIATIDRQPKDSYWLYKANLWKKPFVSIGSKRWTLRSGIAESTDKLQCTQPVEIYSNQPSVMLKLNGKDLGSVNTVDGAAAFNVPFINGENRLQAITFVNDEQVADEVLIDFNLVPANLKSTALPFTELNVSLGDKRFIVDEVQQQVWLPEKAYEPGSWGYIGGEVFTMKGNGRISYGSDKNILGTDNDPVFETQRVGIEQFKLDVPDGTYEVTLHFAELLSNQKGEELVYNLSTTGSVAKKDEISTRAFDVAINNVTVVENLSNSNYLEPDKAYSSKVMVNASHGKGIVINFKARTGQTILNGLQVRKLF